MPSAAVWHARGSGVQPLGATTTTALAGGPARWEHRRDGQRADHRRGRLPRATPGGVDCGAGRGRHGARRPERRERLLRLLRAGAAAPHHLPEGDAARRGAGPEPRRRASGRRASGQRGRGRGDREPHGGHGAEPDQHAQPGRCADARARRPVRLLGGRLWRALAPVRSPDARGRLLRVRARAGESMGLSPREGARREPDRQQRGAIA